jgi:L-iditol 2-dehydrogenase
MRAIVYHGPQQLILEDVAEQPRGAGEVRLIVEAAGICGTDVRIYKGEHRAYANQAGRIPGHEVVGRVVEADPSDLREGMSIGDRVFLAPNIGCGSCARCASGNENLCSWTQAIGITLDGGFAESVIVPAAAVAQGNLIPVSESIIAESAVLIEPLACVLRGQEKVRTRPGETVLVAGAGPVGLLHVALAKATGAGVVICSEPSASRRAAAQRAGANFVIDPMAVGLEEAVADLTAGEGVDVVITAAPIHALQASALEMAGPGGRVLLFGGLPKSRPTVKINTNAIHYKELTVVGTTASTTDDCRRASQLVNLGVIDLEGMTSDVLQLGRFSTAIEKAQDASALKVVLTPQPPAP